MPTQWKKRVCLDGDPQENLHVSGIYHSRDLAEVGSMPECSCSSPNKVVRPHVPLIATAGYRPSAIKSNKATRYNLLYNID